MNPYEMRKQIISQMFHEIVEHSGLDSSKYDLSASEALMESFLSSIQNTGRHMEKMRKIQKINRAIDSLQIVEMQENPITGSSDFEGYYWSSKEPTHGFVMR